MNYIKKYPLTLLCVAAIWYLSFFTPPPMKLDNVVGIDKLVHTAMYGGLCFLFWWEHFRSRFSGKSQAVSFRAIVWKWAFWYALVAPMTMGGLIEILQENYTNHRRSGDWWDFGANSLGVVLMYFIAMLIERKAISCYPKQMYRLMNLGFRRSLDRAPRG